MFFFFNTVYVFRNSTGISYPKGAFSQTSTLLSTLRALHLEQTTLVIVWICPIHIVDLEFFVQNLQRNFLLKSYLEWHLLLIKNNALI